MNWHGSMKGHVLSITPLVLLAGVMSAGVYGQGTSATGGRGDALNRTTLPIPQPLRPTYTELDVRDAKPPARFEVTAPKDAPNVVIILVDDLGFGATSTFGGPIPTPTLDRLAKTGLRFNNFHTTSLCSPTRVALKCGRNHHTANAGSIMETSTAFPGNTGSIPNRVAPLAEVLRLNGFSTAAFGKWHETAPWETSVSGPFDRWPTRQGFDKFYGFIGGETDQWAPLIYDGVKKVNPPKRDGYHFTEDMTDQAINWVKAQQSMTPDKPFFMYFATGATHAPHHVPKDWIEKFHGKFDSGWDAVRQSTYERQKTDGIIPGETKLPPRPDDIVAWDSLPEDHKTLFRRQAEVFGAFVAHTDHHIGRLVQAIDDLGEMDNTLVFYIAGDNGTSAEGGMVGMYNEMTYFNGVTEKVKDLLPLLDKWGSKETFPHMAAGWAVSFDAPFKWTKQVASDFGGTRNGMVAHWPQGIKKGDGIRTQFGHVIDIAPTILEACKLPEPEVVNGVPQLPIEGTSLLYTFDSADAPDRHTTQYFEMFGNRAIYRDGWLARTIHRAPWKTTDLPPLTSDVWELYHVDQDYSLAVDLAAEHPEKLAEMQDLFMTEAIKHHVLPIDDRTIERANPALAGRPDVLGDRTSLTLYEGMEGMLENTFINVKNRSFSIAAEIEIPEDGTSGAILVQGGRFGGWSLHLREGKPAYEYNWLGMQRYLVEGPTSLPPGKATVQLEFAYDGGGYGKGGTATLSVDGQQVAQGRIEKTQPNLFSADETADVGIDNQTPVAKGIGYGPEETKFTGQIKRITIQLK
ncbi:sulfatase-like hydrolase/transferase [Stieleria sp. ICT_E10.1]|uniref:arylsulfatase n=1 Tax=Stieleria sedimenti TaxID=2976331 RepID=UPI00217F2E7A|nr:arylsulfatase [Stieleria sedimenti]MCS7466259.1 sulfatase-like hydrolase/transferase [Stieleria sedimenti]